MQMPFKCEHKYSAPIIKVARTTRRFYKLRSHFSSQLPVMSPLSRLRAQTEELFSDMSRLSHHNIMSNNNISLTG